MAEPTLLTEKVDPEWDLLDEEEKLVWRTRPQAPPFYVNEKNEVVFAPPRSYFYSLNSNLLISDQDHTVPTCPITRRLPDPLPLAGLAWIKQSRLANNTTARYGVCYLTLFTAVEADTVCIITQGYGRKKIRNKRPPRTRHVRVLEPLDVGDFNLEESNGYFASTAGNNRFAKIRGRTAARRPDQPLAALKVVNKLSGQKIWQTVPNPFNGKRSYIKRPEHSDP